MTTTTASASRSTAPDDRWLDLLAEAGGVRGDAVATLARHMVVEYSLSLITAARISVDLLSHASDAQVAVVASWLRSGWHGSLGELLDSSSSAST